LGVVGRGVRRGEGAPQRGSGGGALDSTCTHNAYGRDKTVEYGIDKTVDSTCTNMPHTRQSRPD